LVPSIPNLSIDARRRLQAIEEFSDLGSGFNVAMRDMDIRGSGNLLGGEQSGFISEIGFEMYHKILDEAIHELKEDEFADVFTDDRQKTKDHGLSSKDCIIETDFEALIPDEYVRNIGERLSLYNMLSAINSMEELEKFAKDLTDRFGPIPQQVTDLMDLIQLRETAKKLGFVKIVLKNNLLIATFPPENNKTYYESNLFINLLQYIQQNGHACKLKQTSKTLQVLMNNVNEIKKGEFIFEKMKSFTEKQIGIQ
jgi:transcription-repair coupling factor (superfamily II helicase)